MKRNEGKKKKKSRRRNDGLPPLWVCCYKKQKLSGKANAADLACQLDLFIKMHQVV